MAVRQFDLFDLKIKFFYPITPSTKTMIRNEMEESGWQVACRTELGWGYVENCINTADVAFLVTKLIKEIHVKRVNGKAVLDESGKRVIEERTVEAVVGVSLAKIFGQSAYLSLLCSKGDERIKLGGFLLCLMLNYLLRLGITGVYLDTKPSLINYYSRYGFRVETNTNPVLIEYQKELNNQPEEPEEPEEPKEPSVFMALVPIIPACQDFNLTEAFRKLFPEFTYP